MAPNNFGDMFNETKNIFKANYRHIITLSLIFLFPFSLFLSSTLSNLFNQYSSSSTTNPQQHEPQHHSLFFHLLYSLFSLVFSTCGVITITYSVFHFFNNQPISLKSALKSISTSFFPLLATTLVSQAIIFCISLFHALLSALIIYSVVLVLFNATAFYSCLYFLTFSLALALLSVVIYLQVNWTLAPAIVVLESCWGLEPLRRSARLVKGMRGVALSSFLVYGFFESIVVLNFFLVTKDSNRSADNWVTVVCYWAFIVLQSYFVAVFMASNIIFNTVLYAYCKANDNDDHGELAEEFEKEGLIRLHLHDGKASNAV